MEVAHMVLDDLVATTLWAVTASPRRTRTGIGELGGEETKPPASTTPSLEIDGAGAGPRLSASLAPSACIRTGRHWRETHRSVRKSISAILICDGAASVIFLRSSPVHASVHPFKSSPCICKCRP